MEETADLIKRSGWGLTGYDINSRLYRLYSERFPDLFAKVFHEKDVPIQVAIGNYDLGICGLDWVQELMVKYPSSDLVRLKGLGYGAGALYLVAGGEGGISSLDEIESFADTVRIAGEYPHIAESLALELRLRRFSIFPLWGGAEVYPPESAELAIVSGMPGQNTFGYGLLPLDEVLSYSAFIIANRKSLETKDLAEVLSSLDEGCGNYATCQSKTKLNNVQPIHSEKNTIDPDTVRLALPDGHQQQPTRELLSRAGIKIDDYPSSTGNRRPYVDGALVKVIRPQDMPLQVANDNFDLAITGTDWVNEHLYQFPSSPVKRIVDLKFGWVRIVAVVTKDTPVSDSGGLRQIALERRGSLRLASEYINIADKYARDNHLGNYRIVPTWGATEAFLPEDADLLVENTQTGRTLAKNNLKIIDTLFQSTACLIGNSKAELTPNKRMKLDSIVRSLTEAVEVS